MADFIDVNGLSVHYELSGYGGPLIVFSNSLGTDFRTWDSVIDILSDRMTCLTYDSRGHGLTEITPGPYTIETLSDDLDGLLDVLGVVPTLVCGLSVGGMIAQHYAATHQDKLKGLVLCDTCAKILTKEVWDGRIAAIAEGGLEALADATMERWFTEAFRTNNKTGLMGMRNMLTRTPEAGYVATSYALRDADLRQSTPTIGVPTLVLCGEEDGSTTPEAVKETADMITHAHFHLIKGAGHIPCVEQPEITAAHILAFARQHDLI